MFFEKKYGQAAKIVIICALVKFLRLKIKDIK